MLPEDASVTIPVEQDVNLDPGVLTEEVQAVPSVPSNRPRKVPSATESESLASSVYPDSVEPSPEIEDSQKPQAVLQDLADKVPDHVADFTETPKVGVLPTEFGSDAIGSSQTEDKTTAPAVPSVRPVRAIASPVARPEASTLSQVPSILESKEEAARLSASDVAFDFSDGSSSTSASVSAPPVVPSTRPARQKTVTPEGPVIPSTRPYRGPLKDAVTESHVVANEPVSVGISPELAPQLPSTRPAKKESSLKSSEVITGENFATAGSTDFQPIETANSPDSALSTTESISVVNSSVDSPSENIPTIPKRPARPVSVVFDNNLNEQDTLSSQKEELGFKETEKITDDISDVPTESPETVTSKPSFAEKESPEEVSEDKPLSSTAISEPRKEGDIATESKKSEETGTDSVEISEGVPEEISENKDKSIDSSALELELEGKPTAKEEQVPLGSESSVASKSPELKPVATSSAEKIDTSSKASPPVPVHPVVPARPTRRPPPPVKRPSVDTAGGKQQSSPGLPAVPRRPQKLGGVSAAFEANANKPPPPPVKPKPVGKLNKVGALQASLFNDLNNVISRGGVPMPVGAPKPPSPEKESTEDSDATTAVEKPKENDAKLSDVRRGRAKGPRGRKLPTVAKSAYSTVITDVWSISPDHLVEPTTESTKEKVDVESASPPAEPSIVQDGTSGQETDVVEVPVEKPILAPGAFGIAEENTQELPQVSNEITKDLEHEDVSGKESHAAIDTTDATTQDPVEPASEGPSLQTKLSSIVGSIKDTVLPSKSEEAEDGAEEVTAAGVDASARATFDDPVTGVFGSGKAGPAQIDTTVTESDEIETSEQAILSTSNEGSSELPGVKSESPVSPDSVSVASQSSDTGAISSTLVSEFEKATDVPSEIPDDANEKFVDTVDTSEVPAVLQKGVPTTHTSASLPDLPVDLTKEDEDVDAQDDEVVITDVSSHPNA